MPGQVLGMPGGSLRGAQWAANEHVARIGLDAERRTAATLNALVARGATVLHDLDIPAKNIHANIDHVVVSGRQILIIDSKQWKSGWYWSLGGKVFRGLSRFVPAEKRTLPMAADILHGYLRGQNVRSTVGQLVLVIWSQLPVNTTFYRPPGAPRIVRGERLAAWASHLPVSPADPAIVAALLPLVRK